ncbi:hypothetical protein GCM10010393_13130 [Streptomyces gobitricini]|uniref:Uncharacterized protein n=1 Tax=Streptomyces gobitricini TaxID=68211 RepID=A0ABN3LGS4_9ACTN
MTDCPPQGDLPHSLGVARAATGRPERHRTERGRTMRRVATVLLTTTAFLSALTTQAAAIGIDLGGGLVL